MKISQIIIKILILLNFKISDNLSEVLIKNNKDNNNEDFLSMNNININKKTFSQKIFLKSNKISIINNKSFYKFFIDYLIMNIVFLVLTIVNIFNQKITNDFIKFICGLFLIFFFIKIIHYFYLSWYKKKNNQENEIIVKNKSLYWQFNEINNEKKIIILIQKHIFIFTFLLNVIIVIILYIVKKENKHFILLIYPIIDMILSWSLFYVFKLDNIFINKLFLDENIIMPNEEVLLIRFYGPMSPEQEIKWANNTIDILNKFKDDGNSEEKKINILNNLNDNYLFYDLKKHDQMLIWYKK